MKNKEVVSRFARKSISNKRPFPNHREHHQWEIFTIRTKNGFRYSTPKYNNVSIIWAAETLGITNKIFPYLKKCN